MNIRHLTLEDFTSRLESKEPFTFLRFGDGEWNSIFEKPGCNCDGQFYAPVRDSLTRVLKRASPNYWMGMQPLAWRQREKEIVAWLSKRNLTELNWVWGEALTKVSIHGMLDSFFDALQERNVVLIGPNYLGQMIKWFPIDLHIHVPTGGKVHCNVSHTISNALMQSRGFKDPVFLVSAGMSAEWICHKITQLCPGATCIDTGSLFEPYIGKNIRRYHAKIIERENA